MIRIAVAPPRGPAFRHAISIDVYGFIIVIPLALRDAPKST